MSENSIMTIADFHISEMTAETAAAIEIHNSILSAMTAAVYAKVMLYKNLKRMRDTGQYRALGFEKFEDYTEQACGIKKRQAYNYIATYESLGDTFLQANAHLGITKLQLLTEVCAVDRADFVEQNDLEGMSVSEIKKLIAENKEYSEQISIFSESKERQEPSQEQVEKAVAAKTKELEKSYKDKLKKAKEKERQKAEAEKKKAIEEARTAAKAEADAKYKEQITQAKQDKEAVLSKAKEIASKLDKNADRELVTASLYFSEAQTQFEKFLTAANKITDEKGAKIKKVAADFLKQYIDKLL